MLFFGLFLKAMPPVEERVLTPTSNFEEDFGINGADLRLVFALLEGVSPADRFLFVFWLVESLVWERVSIGDLIPLLVGCSSSTETLFELERRRGYMSSVTSPLDDEMLESCKGSKGLEGPAKNQFNR